MTYTHPDKAPEGHKWTTDGHSDIDDEKVEQGFYMGRDAERERCLRIVFAARTGKIDQDFRVIYHFIKQGEPFPEVADD